MNELIFTDTARYILVGVGIFTLAIIIALSFRVTKKRPDEREETPFDYYNKKNQKKNKGTENFHGF
jgi:hypothetical protein